MLKRLQQDHKNISVLLNILAKQSQQLVLAEPVNFRIMMDVIEYMLAYSEHSHHPVEDIVYRYYSDNTPQAELSDRMLSQHKALTESTESLHQILQQVLNDQPVTTELLQTELEQFIRQQRSHMQYEEEIVFPMLREHISEQGWEAVADLCQEMLIHDPLFSDKVSVECHRLRAMVSESGSE
ncbi:hemerythrin domain-containing protein [Shewanella corallii]|uniref:Hemerythrin domain-containing protein n=1 Tax=Shewanella corallii TaxID=560080 RepID=A0ABT0N6A7_9GAMM|nr:hemerythrin domain-containing protein [Shewanella corallii]MCL2913372.1 hemerythrin domain-containing protein [Shewanella corallii]